MRPHGFLGFLAVALVLAYVVAQPDSAALMVREIADGLGTFVAHLGPKGS